MNAVNQPENTTKPVVRDAAVQIGEEEEGLLGPQALALAQMLDKTPKDKIDLLMEGFCKKGGGAGRFDVDRTQLFTAFVHACITIDRLTSCSKFDRQSGKEKVRAMVKLGKGE